MGKKLLSLLLAVVLIAMVLPMTAMASVTANLNKSEITVTLNGEGQTIQVTYKGTSKNDNCTISIPSGLAVTMNGNSLKDGDPIASGSTSGSKRVNLTVTATKYGDKTLSFSSGASCLVKVVCAHQDQNGKLNLTRVPAVAGKDCLTPGTAEYWKCENCKAFFGDSLAKKPLADVPKGENGNHVFTDIQKRYEGDCQNDGYEAYWYCNTCNLYYSSDDVNAPLTAGKQNKTTVKGTKHVGELMPVAYKKYECETTPSGEYYLCGCGACFAEMDSTGTPCKVEDFVTLPHKLVAGKDSGKSATCAEQGVKEYQVCEVCNKFFTTDKPGGFTQKELDQDPTLLYTSKLEHQIQHSEGSDASCAANGEKPHDYCAACKQYSVDGGETWHTKDENEGAWYQENISISGHKGVEYSVEADCTGTGVKPCLRCSVCEAAYSVDGGKTWFAESDPQFMELLFEDKNPSKHRESQRVTQPSVAPTCTTPGTWGYWTCRCGTYDCFALNNEDGTEAHTKDFFDRPADGKSHTVSAVFHKGRDANCVQKGKVAYYECANEGCTAMLDAEGHVLTDAEGNPLTSVDIPKDPDNHKNLEYREGEASTCDVLGYKEHWKCVGGCEKLFVKDENGNLVETTADKLMLDEYGSTHVRGFEDLTPTPATCVDPGHVGYWQCEKCGKFFAADDEDGSKGEIDRELCLDHYDPTNHPKEKFKFHGPEDATCFADGWDAYWYCSACKKYFAEDDLNTPIDKKSTFKRPKLEHDWHAGEKDAGVEYEVCSKCGFYRLADGSIVEGIPSMHTLDFHQGYPATCTEAGEYDYWFCTDKDCGLMFKDLNATEILKDAVIPAKGHEKPLKQVEHVENCWVCTACGMYFRDAKGTKPMEQPGEVQDHALVYHDKVEPNCQTGDGHEQYWLCVACGDLYADKDGVAMTSLNKVQIPYRANNPEHHHVIEVKATTENIAYWECQDCGMCFDGNKEGAKVLDPSEVGKTENVGDHSLKFQPQVSATCTTDGVKTHWLCLSSHNCNKYYADSLAKTPMTKAELAIPAAHTYIHFKGTAADMDNEGRKGYDYCTVCHLVRLDGSESWITMEEAMKNWGIDKDPDRSEAVLVKKVAPTCIKTGVKKHWECKDLRNDNKTLYFLDEALTQQVSEADLVIPMVNHTLYPVAETGTAKKYWKCLVCHGCFETDDPTPGKPGGGEEDFVKPTEPAPDPTDPPEGVIKDGLDLSGMTVTTGGGKYNAP